MSNSKAIETFFIEGRAGKLEALLNQGADKPSHAALVCHPHPVFGGTLHNKVVFHLMKAINYFGIPVLRFNFRGAGLSEGKHDNGRGELEDVRTGLDWLNRRFNRPMIFAGFSFGAAVGLRIACTDSRVAALIAAGTPVVPVDNRAYDLTFLKDCAKPKLFVSGGHDQYGPRRELELLVKTLSSPTELRIIEGTDHFFEGRLPKLREIVETWMKKTFPDASLAAVTAPQP